VKVVLVLTAAVCLSCLLTGPGCDKSAGADYWPMAEGNQWVFREVEIIAQPDSTPDTLIDENYMTWKCGSEVTLGSGTKAWVMDVGSSDSMYFRDSGSAVLLYDDVSDTDPDTWLLLPLEEGKTWHYASGTMTVREKGTVEVPAGTFKNCWKVEMLGSGIQHQLFLWLAPNVGLVLMEQSSEGQGYSYTSRIELTSKVIK
jgi:hypothetical protein